jgi:tetratricopeptide (TPR) repeat protein
MTQTQASATPVGRAKELAELTTMLDGSAAGVGGTVILLGEPGIGKTRLLDEFKRVALDRGAALLCGAAKADWSEAFGPFAEALDESLEGELLAPRRTVGFRVVFAMDGDGALISSRSSEGSESEAGTVAGILGAVQGFVKDSFEGASGSLGRLEYGETKVLVQHGRRIFLAGVVEGEEHEGMVGVLRDALASIEGRLGELLVGWPGKAEEVLRDAPELRSLCEARFHMRRSLEGVSLENERARIAESIVSTLRMLARDQVVVLVLEDMHWADPSSLYVLTFAARNARGSHLLILSTARTGEGEAFQRAREAMRAEETASELLLGGLSAEDVSGLVGSLYKPNEFDPGFVRKLAEDSRGNPLFVVEALRQLESEGGIVQEKGSYILASGEYSVPGTVEEVVRRRLDSLEPDALAFAEYASCIGTDFPLQAALSIDSIADAAGSARKLAGSGIVLGEGERWRFSHALFRQVVYQGISDRWRIAHHRALGGYYEGAFRGRLDEVVFDLARHFRGCGEWEKALSYCTMAGEKAEDTYAIEDAHRFYEAALESLANAKGVPDPEDMETMLLERAGEMELKLGSIDAALEKLGKVQTRAGDDPDTTLRIAMKRRAGFAIKNDTASAYSAMDEAAKWLDKASGDVRADFLAEWVISCLQVGRNDEAEGYAREALAAVAEVANPVKRARIYNNVSQIHMFANDFPKALPIMQLSLKEAELSGDPRELARAYSEMGMLLHFMTDHVQAAQFLEKAAAIREKLGDIVALAQTLGNLGMAYSDSGNLEMSLSCLKRALAVHRKVGAERGMATVMGNIGYSLAVMGRNEESLRYQEEALALRLRVQGPGGAGWSYFDMSIVYNNMGNFVKERELLEKAAELWERRGEKFGLAQAKLCLGRLALRDGDLTRARRLFEEGLSLASYADMKNMVIFAKRHLVEIGALPAEETLTELDRGADELNDDRLRMALAETRTQLALEANHPARAIECAAKGLAIWRDSGSRDLDGDAVSMLLLSARAKANVGDLAGARADATEAARLGKECGRTWLAKEAEDFLAGLKG